MEGGKESNRVPPYRPGRRLMPGKIDGLLYDAERDYMLMSTCISSSLSL